MSPKIEKISESLRLGEAPHWDAKSQVLYFIDIQGKTIHKYVPSTKKCTKAHLGQFGTGFMIPVEGQDGKFIITQDKSIAILTWDGESPTVSKIEKLIDIETTANINDGKCDPSGRLWFGTLGEVDKLGKTGITVKSNIASIYSLSKRELKTHHSGLGLSNGLAFNPPINKGYYIDSSSGAVHEYDFNLKEGTLTNRKPIFTLAKHGIEGFPDGMCIDVDGNLWVAVLGTGVLKIDPRKPETLLECLKLPVTEVTSVSFGGANLDELYVTTASFTEEFSKNSVPEIRGATYKVTGLGVKGLPGVNFKLA